MVNDPKLSADSLVKAEPAKLQSRKLGKLAQKNAAKWFAESKTEFTE